MIGSKRFIFTGISVILLLTAFYVYQVQAYARAGFVVSAYEKQLEDISRSQRGLAVNFSEVNSPANLETMLKSANYQDIGQVRYIQVTGAQVAVK